MAETDLLERAQEAVGNDPLPSDLLPKSEDDARQDEFAAWSKKLVDMSRKGIAKMEDLIARVRAHPDNDPDETFRELGPLLSVRISKREDHLGQLVLLDRQSRRIKNDSVIKRLRAGLAQVITQLGREHRSLVTLYYTLKADADEVAGDTRGGPVLTSPDAIDEFFDRHSSAK